MEYACSLSYFAFGKACKSISILSNLIQISQLLIQYLPADPSFFLSFFPRADLELFPFLVEIDPSIGNDMETILAIISFVRTRGLSSCRNERDAARPL
jgi:hypothetical protein